MSYEFYKVLHVLGLAWLFAALGAQVMHGLAEGTRETHPARGLVMGSHGVALVIVLVAGFGMHAKLGFPPGAWLYAKLAIWLVLGALAAVPLRKPELSKPVFLSLPVLAGLATWLAIAKPF